MSQVDYQVIIDVFSIGNWFKRILAGECCNHPVRILWKQGERVFGQNCLTALLSDSPGVGRAIRKIIDFLDLNATLEDYAHRHGFFQEKDIVTPVL